MPTLDLLDRHLAMLREILSAQVPKAEVWAYGSRVKGGAHSASDLDLVLRNPLDLKQPQKTLFDLKEILSESNIPILIDLLDWAQIPEHFHDQIEKGYVVIQEGGAVTSDEDEVFGLWGSWIDTTIEEQFTLQRGFDITKKNQRPGVIPVISSGGISSYNNTAMVDGPGVIIGRKGTLGTVFFVEHEYWPHDTTLWVKDFKNNAPLFVFYFLKSMSRQFFWMDVGSANPTLNRNHVHPMNVKWPEEIKDQQSIAEILSSLDEKIELNRKQNRTLEAIAQALFKRWFVAFEFPDSHGKPYKSNGGAMQSSELGEIPVGWEVGSFSEQAELIGGGTPKTSVSEYWGGDIPWFSVTDAPSGSDTFAMRTEKNITQVGVDNSSTKILRKGTTIVSARGTVGRLALVGKPMAMNQSCYGVQGKSNHSDYFIYLLLQQVLGELRANAHGSVFDTITKETFDNLIVIKPKCVISENFEEMIAPFFEKLKSNHEDLTLLAKLRDTLLPKLMSGELRVG